MWRRVADCSRGSFQPPKMHDRQQWTAVYVGSPAVTKTTMEVAAVGIGDALDVIRGIPWCQIVQASLNEHSLRPGDRSQCRSHSIGVTCSDREDGCICPKFCSHLFCNFRTPSCTVLSSILTPSLHLQQSLCVSQTNQSINQSINQSVNF